METLSLETTAAPRAEPLGWDDLHSRLAPGQQLDTLEHLQLAREFLPIYPYLKALTSTNALDFIERVASMSALIAVDSASFTQKDLERALYWFTQPAREGVLLALRRSGWLEYDEETRTTRISDAARMVFENIALLKRSVREDDLLSTVSAIENALQVGIPPTQLIQALRSRLNRLYDDIKKAEESHSEVILKNSAKKLQDCNKLSTQIRAVLCRVPPAMRVADQVYESIQDLLSRLHLKSSDLHSAIIEMGKQYLNLTAGMTIEQIVRVLRSRSKEELASVAKRALFGILVPPPYINTSVAGEATIQQASKNLGPPEKVKWIDPPVIGTTTAPEESRFPDARKFLAELLDLVRSGKNVDLSMLIQQGSLSETFLRANLLPFVGIGGKGEGLVAQFGRLPLQVETSNKTEPVKGPFLKEMTAAKIILKSREEHSRG